MRHVNSPGLFDLAGRLAGEIGRFVDQRLELFRVELRQEAADTAKSAALFAAGGVGASIGALFLLVALGLWIGDAVGSTSGGFAIVGGGLALVSGVLGFVANRIHGRRRFLRATAADLRRDAEWIKHEV